MAFNQLNVKSYASGAVVAFPVAPLTTYTASKIALNGVTTGLVTSTAGLVLAMNSTRQNVEWDSLSANVQVQVTTNALVVTPRWQVSNDGTNWADVVPFEGQTYLAMATGTGSLVTTTLVTAFLGINPGHPYIRYAVLSSGATGAAGDNVYVSYNYRTRWTVS